MPTAKAPTETVKPQPPHPIGEQITRLEEKVNALIRERDGLASELADAVRATPDGPRNIVELLAKASEMIGPVGKDKEMKEGPHYEYRSIEAILSLAQDVFSRLQIVPSAKILDRIVEKVPRGSNNVMWNHVHLHVRWTFTAPDGSKVRTEMWGEGLDPGDKASNKAKTASRKYALIDVLNLAEKGADPDDYHPPEEYAQQRPQEVPQTPAIAPEEQERRQLSEQWNLIARQLTDVEKLAFRGWCEDNGIPVPGTQGVQRPAVMYRAMISEAERTLRARKVDPDPNADPPHPTEEEPQVAPEPAREESIQEMRDRIARVQRDGSHDVPETVPDDEGEDAPHGGYTVPEAAAPAVGEGEATDVPAEAPEAEKAPEGKVAYWRCGTCSADVKGRVGDPCPIPKCGGVLTDEMPFAFLPIRRGDDAPFTSRHRWAPRRGDGRWPGQF